MGGSKIWRGEIEYDREKFREIKERERERKIERKREISRVRERECEEEGVIK